MVLKKCTKKEKGRGLKKKKGQGKVLASMRTRICIFLTKLGVVVHAFTVLEMQKQADPRVCWLASTICLLRFRPTCIYVYMQRWGRQKWGVSEKGRDCKEGPTE